MTPDEKINQMAADAVPENAPGLYMAGPGPEPLIYVNDNRDIIVPDELQNIAVEHDHNIETVTFDCPRYWDEHDMFNMNVYINYQTPDNSLNCYPVHNKKVSDTDQNRMTFDWTISRDVTKYKGTLRFLICIKELSGSEEITHWNSNLCTSMYVSEGLECDETLLEDYPDIIEQLVNALIPDAAFSPISEGALQNKVISQNVAGAITSKSAGELITLDDTSPIPHLEKIKVTGKNLFNINNDVAKYQNIAYNEQNNCFEQIKADTATWFVFKLQAYKGPKYIKTIETKEIKTIGSVSFSFTKNNEFDTVAFGITGSTTDTLIFIKMNLTTGLYTISCNLLNKNQGTVSWNNVQLEKGSVATPYTPFVDFSKAKIISSGKNIILYPYTDGNSLSRAGISYQVLNRRIHIKGTANGNSVFNILASYDSIGSLQKGKTYNINRFGTNGKYGIAVNYYDKNRIERNSGCNSWTQTPFTVTDDWKGVHIYIVIMSGQTVDDYVLPCISEKYPLEYLIDPTGIAYVPSMYPYQQIYCDYAGTYLELDYNKDLDKEIKSIPQTYAGALKNNAMGEVIALDDVSEIPHIVNVKAESKNLIKIDTKTSTINITFNLNNTYKAGKYVFSCDIGCTSQIKELRIRCFNSSNMSETLFTQANRNVNNGDRINFALNVPKVFNTIRITDQYHTPEQDITYSNIQFEKGTTATPYTPYVEDISVIKSKNLFNYTGEKVVTDGGITANFESSKIIMSGSGGPTNIFLIDFVADGNYFLSGGYNVRLYFSAVNENGIEFKDEGNGVIIQEGTYKIYLRTLAGTNCSGITLYPQLEKGSEATPYEPYFDPKPAKLHSCGLNIIDLSTINEWEQWNNTKLKFKYFKVKPNTEYIGATNITRYSTIYFDPSTSFVGNQDVLSDETGKQLIIINPDNITKDTKVCVCEKSMYNEVMEKYKGTSYPINSDGTVDNVQSISPNQTLYSDNDGVSLNVLYNADLKKYIDKKIAEGQGGK